MLDNNFEMRSIQNKSNQGNVIIDSIINEENKKMQMMSHDEGYSAHSDGWIDYTDHSDHSDSNY